MKKVFLLFFLFLAALNLHSIQCKPPKQEFKGRCYYPDGLKAAKAKEQKKRVAEARKLAAMKKKAENERVARESERAKKLKLSIKKSNTLYNIIEKIQKLKCNSSLKSSLSLYKDFARRIIGDPRKSIIFNELAISAIEKYKNGDIKMNENGKIHLSKTISGNYYSISLSGSELSDEYLKSAKERRSALKQSLKKGHFRIPLKIFTTIVDKKLRECNLEK